MQNDSYTDWTLISQSPFALWQLILLSLLAGSITIWVLWGYRSARRPYLLMLPRILTALLVIAFIFEPAMQLRVVRKIKNRLAIVVDRSRSMELSTASDSPRYDAIRALLNQSGEELKALADSHNLDWYDLEGPVNPSLLAQNPDAEKSDLLSALEHARDGGAGKALAGIVLISDGADNADLENRGKGGLSDTAMDRLSRIGAPVNTIVAGDSQNYKDLGITDIKSDEFAFVHNTIEIDLSIDNVGFEASSLPITLKRDGEVAATQEAQIKSGTTHVVLKTKPDKIGEFVYSVSIPTLAQEAITTNNERTFVLKVIRDKIRVLQVAGRPSWDERFLRQHLKENPNVDLISFFILRTPGDNPGAPENELSLIPFPVDKLFTTELRSFDVVIFQNFEFRPYRMDRYLPNIRDAVKQSGLGFAMFGGEDSFDGGGYAGTPIEEILPVRVTQGSYLKGNINPQLTESGRRHPITLLSNSNNEVLWRELSPWFAINRLALAPNATALASDPRANGAPLISVMEADQGRSLAVATDSLWRWRFSAAKNIAGHERAYDRFLSNALRWLVRDPDHARLRVVPDKRRYHGGEAVDVSFSLLAPDYQAVPHAKLKVSLERVGAGVAQVDDISTGDTGVARHRYDNLEEGAYRITADYVGAKIEPGVAVFVVEAQSMELIKSAPRADLMNAIAENTHGAALPLSPELWEKLRIKDPEVIEVDRRRTIELWDNGWALAAALTIFVWDWVLRRRRGYL